MQRWKENKGGFTLTELVVVLAIVILLSVLSVNAYLSFTASRRIHYGLEMLVNVLSAARSQAIATQSPYRVVIQRRNPVSGVSESAFWIDELDPSVPTSTLYPSANELATGVKRQQVHGIITAPEGIVVREVLAGTASSMPGDAVYALVVFSPSGSATYASIKLEDSRARDDTSRFGTVKVYPATGRALAEEGAL
ncbi:MAG: prepilin-type N-terminal cleavage/methylation domain-containing protein [Candidatus Sumerlaeaceae bacterium]|nr:prepilin-type N-terminal cleavage/methylation domain-containing protein [Candidatus Sumerlaeaceae bacterium]